MSAHNYNNEKAREVHFRLFGYEAKLVTDELNTIKKACKFLGLTLSEFCRMAAFKEARRTLLDYQKDKLLFAKKILLEEEMKNKKKELEVSNEAESRER
jgi:hypothetical protein